MSDLTTLTSVQLEALRKEWLVDYVDQHPEWGTSPTVQTSAAAGAATLSLTGLGLGTINVGCGFYHLAGGVQRPRYTVTLSIPIVAGAAVVSISPLLQVAATAGDRVEVEWMLRSVFNKRTRRQFFSDDRLQGFCQRAWDTYGERIASSPDPQRTLYKVIRTFAYDEMLAGGSEFLSAVLADDVRGNGARLLDRMVADRDKDLSDLNTGNRGHRTVFLEK